MKKKEKYSCTSNTVKLLKHLDVLKNTQEGIASPIMVHIIPTHKCQLSCVHCCFKNRVDKSADMPFDMYKTGLNQFLELGIKSIEFTGGGDPTMWPYLNDAIVYAKSLGLHIGLITNAVSANNVNVWDKLDWVRVSLNVLDYREDLDISCIKDHPVSITFCYIWNQFSDEKIEKVSEYSNNHKIVCRVAPDCIKPLKDIENDLEYIGKKIEGLKDNNYLFLSDFNIETKRRNNKCYIHLIKPCFYLDGYIYACPSAELALENDKQVQDKVRICKFDDVKNYYSKGVSPLEFGCSYCKYVKQQELIEDLLTETDFNEFA